LSLLRRLENREERHGKGESRSVGRRCAGDPRIRHPCFAFTAADVEEPNAGAERFIRSGVTVGLALTAQIKFPMVSGFNTTAQLMAAKRTAMPYVVFLPAYWGYRKDQAAYCAALRSVPDKEVRVAAAKALVAQGEGVANATQTATQEYKCPLSWLGAYIGFPLEFESTVEIPSQMFRGSVDLRPTGSFGLALTPNAVVSILLGLTASNFSRADQTESNIWTITLGIGGNLDLVKAMLD